MSDELTLVRVVGPDFVAGFETDGTVRRAAPIIGYFVGWSDAKVREHVKARGWKASIVNPRPRLIQHWQSFEVWRDGKRKFFYFDENPGRRAVTGAMSKDAALREALAHLGTEVPIEIGKPGKPPW